MKKKTIREQVAEIVVEAKIGNIWTNGPLSYADRILALIDKELEDFIPSEGDRFKHRPTDEQAELCRGAYQHYARQVPNKNTLNEYDFNRGFEFGYGACLLKLRAVREVLKGGVK